MAYVLCEAFRQLSVQQFAEVLDGANHLACVGVLVVVPRNNLNLSKIIADRQNHGLCCICLLYTSRCV